MLQYKLNKSVNDLIIVHPAMEQIILLGSHRGTIWLE